MEGGSDGGRKFGIEGGTIEGGIMEGGRDGGSRDGVGKLP